MDRKSILSATPSGGRKVCPLGLRSRDGSCMTASEIIPNLTADFRGLSFPETSVGLTLPIRTKFDPRVNTYTSHSGTLWRNGSAIKANEVAPHVKTMVSNLNKGDTLKTVQLSAKGKERLAGDTTAKVAAGQHSTVKGLKAFKVGGGIASAIDPLVTVLENIDSGQSVVDAVLNLGPQYAEAIQNTADQLVDAVSNKDISGLGGLLFDTFDVTAPVTRLADYATEKLGLGTPISDFRESVINAVVDNTNQAIDTVASGVTQIGEWIESWRK